MKARLPQNAFRKNAEIYKILSNPKRLEILNTLNGNELCVEELAKTLKLRKANISQHLTILRYARLVTMERRGLYVYYKIIDPQVIEPCLIFHELRKRRNII